MPSLNAGWRPQKRKLGKRPADSGSCPKHYSARFCRGAWGDGLHTVQQNTCQSIWHLARLQKWSLEDRPTSKQWNALSRVCHRRSQAAQSRGAGSAGDIAWGGTTVAERFIDTKTPFNLDKRRAVDQWEVTAASVCPGLAGDSGCIWACSGVSRDCLNAP